MYFVDAGLCRSSSSTFPDTTSTTPPVPSRPQSTAIPAADSKVNFLVGSPSTDRRRGRRRRHAPHHGGIPTGTWSSSVPVSSTAASTASRPLIYTPHHGSSVTFCSNGPLSPPLPLGDTLVDAAEVLLCTNGGGGSRGAISVPRPSSGYFTDDDCSGRHSRSRRSRRKATGNSNGRLMATSSPPSSVATSSVMVDILDDEEGRDEGGGGGDGRKIQRLKSCSSSTLHNTVSTTPPGVSPQQHQYVHML